MITFTERFFKYPIINNGSLEDVFPKRKNKRPVFPPIWPENEYGVVQTCTHR